MSGLEPVPSQPLDAAVARAAGAANGLLGLGRPRCPASELLAVSLAEIAAARPGLAVGYCLLRPEDWARREELLWPRDIRVSPSSVPALALLEDGRTVARRIGGGPAERIDAWLTPLVGPAESPLESGLSPAEIEALGPGAARRAQHRRVKDRESESRF